MLCSLQRAAKCYQQISPASIPTHSLLLPVCPRACLLPCSRTENVVELLSTLLSQYRPPSYSTSSRQLPSVLFLHHYLQHPLIQHINPEAAAAMENSANPVGKGARVFPNHLAFQSSRIHIINCGFQSTISNYFLGCKQILIATTKCHLTFKLSHTRAAVSRFLLKP